MAKTRTPALPYKLILATKEFGTRELSLKSNFIQEAVDSAQGYLLTGFGDEEIRIEDQEGRWYGTVTSDHRSPWL
jgi:hypothetical protein